MTVFNIVTGHKSTSLHQITKRVLTACQRSSDGEKRLGMLPILELDGWINQLDWFILMASYCERMLLRLRQNI